LTTVGYDFVENLRLGGYRHNACIESSIYDAGSAVNWENVSWSENRPSGTSIVVKVRTGSTSNPDNSWSGWYVHGNGTENPALPSYRYAQYCIDMSTDNRLVTPTFYDITLNYL
jgi:hypothetical protein